MIQVIRLVVMLIGTYRVTTAHLHITISTRGIQEMIKEIQYVKGRLKVSKSNRI